MKFIEYIFPEKKTWSHDGDRIGIFVIRGRTVLDPDDHRARLLVEDLGGKPGEQWDSKELENIRA